MMKTETLKILTQLRSDLFYQIESKFGSKKASKYPSIVNANKLIAKLIMPVDNKDKLYTEKEVKDIVNILADNKKNIAYSISQGRNSVNRFLKDFNDGKY